MDPITKSIQGIIASLIIGLLGFFGWSVITIDKKLTEISTKTDMLVEKARDTVSRTEYDRFRESVERSHQQNFERIGQVERRMDLVKSGR